MKKASVGIVTSILLAPIVTGCVGASTVQMAEIQYINKNKTGTLHENVQLAGALADEYIRLSAQASGAQDLAAVGIIAAAGVAAGGLLYDANLNLIKGAGLAAGTVTASSTYFRPGETSTALLDAAEQMICVRKAGESLLGYDNADPEAGEILMRGILTARLNLRKRLNRTLPDYRSLVEAIRNSPAAAAPAENDGRVTKSQILDELTARVNTCLLPG